MHLSLILVLGALTPVTSQQYAGNTQPGTDTSAQKLEPGDTEKLLKELNATTRVLVRQMMLEQWYTQERIR